MQQLKITEESIFTCNDIFVIFLEIGKKDWNKEQTTEHARDAPGRSTGSALASETNLIKWSRYQQAVTDLH